MTEAITLKNLLEDVKAVGHDGLEKNASAQNVPGGSEKISTQAETELLDTLRGIIGTNDEKTAAAPPADPGRDASGVDMLVKMASNLAGTEQQATIKEAHLYGAAVADGFVSRLNQYDQSLDAAGVKTASAESFAGGVPTEEEFVKFAEANPDAVQAAMDQGYESTMAKIAQVKTAAATNVELEKIASTPAGQAEIAHLEKLASTIEGQSKLAGARQGFIDGVNDIVKLAETQEGQNKLAEIQNGYAATMGEIEKVANDCFSRGFADTIALVEKATANA